MRNLSINVMQFSFVCRLPDLFTNKEYNATACICLISQCISSLIYICPILTNSCFINTKLDVSTRLYRHFYNINKFLLVSSQQLEPTEYTIPSLMQKKAVLILFLCILIKKKGNL